MREMARVARPGGTVAAAVWDYAGEMTLLRRFWDAAAALDPAARDRDEGRAMRFATPAELAALLASAGLEEVWVEPAMVTAAYDGFEDLWAPLELGVGPAGAYAAALAPEPRAALKAELRRRLGVGDGAVHAARRRLGRDGRADSRQAPSRADAPGSLPASPSPRTSRRA